MNWRDVAAAGAVTHSLVGQDKAAGVLSQAAKSLGRGAQSALRLTAERPILAAGTAGAGALGTHGAHKGVSTYVDELRKAKSNPAFSNPSIRGGLF